MPRLTGGRPPRATASLIALAIALAAPTAVADTPPLALTTPSDITIEATSGSGAAVAFIVTSNRPSANVSCDHAPGSVFAIATTTVACTATDGPTDTASASFSVTVRDTTPPGITVPADIAAAATSAAGAVVGFTASAADTVDGSLSPSCSPASGSAFPLGETTISCTVTDAHGNTGSASFNITVGDATPPVLSLPGDQSATTVNAAGAAVSFTATANDNIDGSVAPSCSPASGATFPVATTTVHCSATDTHGNTSTGTFSITVTLADTTPPVVSVPANVTKEAASGSGAQVAFTASASDNVDGPLPASCSPASGATFPIGSTMVTCRATDAHGNTGSASFTVAVRDTTAPGVGVPAGVTREASSSAGAAVTFSASAIDAVDGSLSPSCTPVSGSTFALSATTVTCRATDAHGNSATASFDVHVVDTTAPQLHLPGDISLTTQSSGGGSATFAVTATDTVDGSIAPSCSPASGATFPVGKTNVACRAADAHGNVSTGSFTVSVTLVDTTPPVVSVPGALKVEAQSSSGATATFSVSATDALDGPVAPTCSRASGSTFAVGTTTVVCNATDKHNNTGSGSFTITIVDTTNPVVHVSDVSVEATSPDGATASFGVSAEDSVDGSLTASCTPASGAQFPVGTTTVTCIATDAHSNTGKASFTATVQDTTGPVVTVQSDLTREANGPAGAEVAFTASASDAVDGPLTPAAVVCEPTSGSVFQLGRTVVTCSASDRRANVGRASFAVTVVDTTPPRLNVPAAITLTGANALPASSPTIAAFLNSANATDLVDGKVPVTNNAPSSFPIGATTVTFTATDNGGHKTTASSSVTVTVAAAPQPAAPDTKPPAKVGNLVARASDGAVSLTWQPPADPDFDHVVVEQSTEGAVGAIVYTGNATGYRATGLNNAVEYRFVVVGYDKAGNASADAVVTATPAAVMLLLPKNGTVQKKPPLLDWRDVAGASYYNVQLYRIPSLLAGSSGLPVGVKVLSLWPAQSRLRVTAAWTFGKKRYRLVPGIYRWYVWPGFGPRADVRYGALLGQSTFVVGR
jgi:large repetitive protein